ncbi:MAG: SH3-like domain-containing protein [Steroidobacteraceae bacterium]
MPALPRDQVAPVFNEHGASCRAEVATPPRFHPGETITARNMSPIGHTRLPRYVRGRRGVIERNHGGFVFADTRAHGLGDHPQYIYSVRFAARDLWGPEACAHDAVYVDLWESYIELASVEPASARPARR